MRTTKPIRITVTETTRPAPDGSKRVPRPGGRVGFRVSWAGGSVLKRRTGLCAGAPRGFAVARWVGARGPSGASPQTTNVPPVRDGPGYLFVVLRGLPCTAPDPAASRLRQSSHRRADATDAGWGRAGESPQEMAYDPGPPRTRVHTPFLRRRPGGTPPPPTGQGAPRGTRTKARPAIEDGTPAPVRGAAGGVTAPVRPAARPTPAPSSPARNRPNRRPGTGRRTSRTTGRA